MGTESYDDSRKIWWWNHVVPNSLRLSKSGIVFIEKHTKIKTYKIKLPNPLLSRTFIQLSRLFTCPYYVQNLNQITLLGEEETVLLTMHANNLQQYLDNLESTQ